MRLSTFNLYVEDYPEPGQTLVHNTFSGAYVVLDEEALAALRKMDRGEELDESERELACDPDLADVNVGVVVESRADEEKEFRDWFEEHRSRAHLEAVVCINLACNFECPYCLQDGVMDGTVMKPETADRTARWLAERALEVGVEEVSLSFVGGEPLLHPERMERISRAIKERVEPEGLRFGFRMITNGYYLSEEMVDRLIPFGLRGVQVTLDGDETTHSKTRVSKKGEDTFQRIFDHVVAASRRIHIGINGNYQEDTLHGFAPLIEKLAEAGLGGGRATVGFSPAMEGLDAPDGAGSGACTWSGSKAHYRVALHDEMLKQGIPAAPIDEVGPCEFHDLHSYAIDPDGTVYKCPGFLGHPEWGIGHVESGLTRRYQQMLRLNPQRECGSCTYRPSCAGGCVAAMWLEMGRPEGVNCEHSYFDTIAEEAAVRGYLLETSDSVGEAVAAFPPPRAELPRAAPNQGRNVRPPALRVVNP